MWLSIRSTKKNDRRNKYRGGSAKKGPKSVSFLVGHGKPRALIVKKNFPRTHLGMTTAEGKNRRRGSW